MSESTEALARRLEEVNADLIGLVESCDDREWGTVCGGERWSVGVVAHHCAAGHHTGVGWIELMRRGEDVPGSPAELAAVNAERASRHAKVTREEVLTALREGVGPAAAQIRGLTEMELGRRVNHGPADVMLSVEQVAQAQSGHMWRHTNSIRVTLGKPAEGP